MACSEAHAEPCPGHQPGDKLIIPQMSLFPLEETDNTNQ